MSYEAIGQLIDRWMNDASFRAALRVDAEAAVRQVGIELDPDAQAALKSIDWSLSDADLMSRVSAAGGA